jgi:transposase
MIEAPDIDLSTIPIAQRAVVTALMETIAALQEITRRQQHLIAEMNHALHGKRSEKLAEDARQLSFEDLSIALGEVEAQKEYLAAKTGDIAATKPAPKRTIGNLPAALPRFEDVIEPDSLDCPCGCGIMHKIGEDRTERLDIVPAQLRVIVTVRPKYACRTCTDGVTQAPARAHLIMGGLPTEGALAHILVSKYADHLPLYRQSQILARAGLDLHRAVLADWVGKAAFHLKPVVDRLAGHLKRSGKLFEPPRVYRRVICSFIKRPYQVCSGLHRTPPLLLLAECSRWGREVGGCYTNRPISRFPIRLRASISTGRSG